MADLLRTHRLIMRRATMDDLDAIHGIMSDPAAMRYWSTPAHQAMADSERWLRSMVGANPAVSDDFILDMDGVAIGKLGCWKLPEIGFLLSRDKWGQGLASEALTVFLDRRCALAPTQSLVADVDPRNASSLKLLQGHGFAETGRAEGTWIVDGEQCDSVYLSWNPQTSCVRRP